MKGKNPLQIDLFDLLFPRKSYLDIQREETEAFEAKLTGFSFDERLIARTYPYLINYAGSIVDDNENEIDTNAEIRQIAATRQNLFECGDSEIWCYEMPDEKWDVEQKEYIPYLGYLLAFRIDNQVISVTYLVEDVLESEICFPAMCMAYMDAAGNPLPFTIRDAFIENGLGLLEHGEYRLGKRGKKDVLDFASLKTTLTKIMDYLEAQVSGVDIFDDAGCFSENACEM